MSSSPVIILNPPATRDSYEYYYYEYDDEEDDDQDFGQSKEVERKGLLSDSTTTEAPAAVASEAEGADDQDASGLFFGGLFKSDKCPYCDKGGYQKEPCCPHVVDGPWLFLLLGSIGLLAIFLNRQVAFAVPLASTIRLCLLYVPFASDFLEGSLRAEIANYKVVCMSVAHMCAIKTESGTHAKKKHWHFSLLRTCFCDCGQ